MVGINNATAFSLYLSTVHLSTVRQGIASGKFEQFFESLETSQVEPNLSAAWENDLAIRLS